MATTTEPPFEFDTEEATLALLDADDDEALIRVMFLTGDLLMGQVADDRELRNTVSASKASTMAGLLRWAPRETVSKVFDEIYGDDPPLTLIRGDRDA